MYGCFIPQISIKSRCINECLFSIGVYTSTRNKWQFKTDGDTLNWDILVTLVTTRPNHSLQNFHSTLPIEPGKIQTGSNKSSLVRQKEREKTYQKTIKKVRSIRTFIQIFVKTTKTKLQTLGNGFFDSIIHILDFFKLLNSEWN